MSRFKTFSNGGSLLPGDLNSIEDDYEGIFALWRDTGMYGFGTSGPAPAVGSHVLGQGNGLMTQAPVAVLLYSFHINPADYAAPNRATKFRIKAGIWVNAVAPGTSFTASIAPVAGGTIGGTSGNASTTTVFGAGVGNPVTFTTPAANTSGPISATAGAEFDSTSLANTWYMMRVDNSGASAAGSVVGIRTILQVRNV